MKLTSKVSVSARAKFPGDIIKNHIDMHIARAAEFAPDQSPGSGKTSKTSYRGFKFDYENIDSVFGQVEEYIPLYGGRPALHPEIMNSDIPWLYNRGIGIKLTLQNKTPTEESYKESKSALKKYNRKGNAVIVNSDKLADWIKNDFPHYKIEASCIQDITDNEHYEKKVATGLYDTIVLPIHCNDDMKFIKSIKRKDLLRLFMNIECSYNCPSKTCYGTTSKINLLLKKTFVCSLIHLGQERSFYNDDIKWDEFYFDLPMYEKMGISKFKLVTPIEQQQRTALIYKRNHDKLAFSYKK